MSATTTSTPADNPLLNGPEILPHFRQVKPEHVTPALDALLADAQQALDRAGEAGTPATWKDFV
ncbi:MAG: hypothetical protein Q4D19_11350, partial [Lautropia sp.]|nr:hypothetical protein [Lautropia sp.]